MIKSNSALESAFWEIGTGEFMALELDFLGKAVQVFFTLKWVDEFSY